MGADVATLVTAEQFAAMERGEGRQQLVEGRVVMAPPVELEHAEYEAIIVGEIREWTKRSGTGRAFGADVWFLVEREPDTVLCPDGGFFADRDRIERQTRGPRSDVPDLVVEIVSPSDRRTKVMGKIGAWLDFGVRIVLVVWPASRRVSVHRSPDDTTTFDDGAVLVVDDLLPGFSLPVAEIFG